MRLIGLTEVLGAIGLILPAATRLVPRLTGVAAVMVLAAGVHVVHGEIANPPVAVSAVSRASSPGGGSPTGSDGPTPLPPSTTWRGSP